jgi:hypothetical protein
MKISRKSLILMLIVLFLVQTGCSSNGGKKESQDTQPEETVPTAEQSSSASDGSIEINPCPFPDKCLDAVSITSFSEKNIQFDQENSITVPASQTVYIRFCWAAKNQVILDQNAANVKFTLDFDGISISNPNYLAAGEIAGAKVEGENSPALCYGISVKGWKAGEQHRVTMRMTFDKAINDGWEYSPAGSVKELIYVIIPADLPKK